MLLHLCVHLHRELYTINIYWFFCCCCCWLACMGLLHLCIRSARCLITILVEALYNAPATNRIPIYSIRRLLLFSTVGLPHANRQRDWKVQIGRRESQMGTKGISRVSEVKMCTLCKHITSATVRFQ